MDELRAKLLILSFGGQLESCAFSNSILLTVDSMGRQRASAEEKEKGKAVEPKKKKKKKKKQRTGDLE